MEALIGLGGNVGEVRATLGSAVAAFCDGIVVRLTARSSDYRTPAWGITAQADFINLCIAVETTLTPLALLERALQVEGRFGRKRASETRWGPRTVDIDILTYGDLAVDDPRLTLPHPRMLERAFVLVPLSEIRPHMIVGGVRIADALNRLDARNIERLPPAP